MRELIYAKGVLWRPSEKGSPLILGMIRNDDDSHRPGEMDLPGGRVHSEARESVRDGFWREVLTETMIAPARFPYYPRALDVYNDRIIDRRTVPAGTCPTPDMLIDRVSGDECVGVRHIVYQARVGHDVPLELDPAVLPEHQAASFLTIPEVYERLTVDSLRKALAQVMLKGLASRT